MTTRHPRSRRGFSLIEVLVAVAVLAFGLLALASLQSAMIRSSTDTKARSVALSLAKDRVEELRGYRTTDEYLALTDSTGTFTDAAFGFGGVDYTVTTTIERVAYNTDPDSDPSTAMGAFETVDDDTAPLTGTLAEDNEFKRVSVRVGWTDANNVPQSIEIEDAIGAVSPENTGRLARRNEDGKVRGPVIRIADPSDDPGVIPIAIGDGSGTAATNPRPDVDTGVTLQTSYDIFTYRALNDAERTAQAQSRIETVIIGCRCDTTEADTGAVDFRPTYWDGERYVLPKEATSYGVQAGEAQLQNNDPDQSILCTTCCRDHHDPEGVAGPKFSPRRDDHVHYVAGGVTPVDSGEYSEACRMIRVDGIFRVAADPYNEYTNILKTAVKTGESEPFTDPRPDEDAGLAYQDFVVDFLETQGLQPDPNDQLTQSVADAKAQSAGLNVDPVEVEIGDERWMHARGLYVDWLEDEALDAIDKSQSDCPADLTPSECLLRALPFTTINLTELSQWTPAVSAAAPVYVANNDFIDSTLSTETGIFPVRGRVTAAADGDADATATIRTSSTGLLADPTYVINPDDGVAQTNNIDDQPDSDGQTFTIVGPACGASPTSLGLVAGGPPGLYPSSSVCEGSDANWPTNATRIQLSLRLGTGPGRVNIRLVAPDGSSYLIATSQNWASIQPIYTFDAMGNPDLGGVWTVQVTNADNGNKTVSTSLGFSVEFRYTAPFKVGLTGYSFVSTTQPGMIVSDGGGCDSLSATNNPTDCDTTNPGQATTVTIGTYNYSTIGVSQTVQCGSATLTCATTLHCKNFDVSGVTLNGTSVSPGTAALPGRITESTPIAFNSGLNANDQVMITMVAGTESTPLCTPKKQGNNLVCPASTGFACE